MKGRIWLVVGVVIGVAIGLGKLPYLAGAATSFADTALRVVDTAGHTLVHDTATTGAPRRIVEGLAALVGVLIPGVTAFVLVCAARATLRLRALLAVLLAALGIAAFFYLPSGRALGVVVLALAAAGIAVAATGPLLATPLAALAALIAATYLPRLVASHSSLPTAPATELHEALFASPGAPLWLRVAILVAGALPFAFAARRILR